MAEIDDFLRSYRDVLTIRVEIGSVHQPIADEVFEVSHPDAVWSRDQTLDELEALTRDERLVHAAGTADSGASVPFSLDTKRSVVSWGVDGASERFVLRVAEWAAGGVVGNAAYHAIRELLGRFSHATSQVERLPPIDRSEALGLAEWGVSEKFDVPPPVAWVEDSATGGYIDNRDQSLALVNEEEDGGRWTFVFRRPPFEYAVSVERLDGYANLTHYRRTRLTE